MTQEPGEAGRAQAGVTCPVHWDHGGEHVQRVGGPETLNFPLASAMWMTPGRGHSFLCLKGNQPWGRVWTFEERVTETERNLFLS